MCVERGSERGDVWGLRFTVKQCDYRSAKILNLLLKSGLATELFVTETAVPVLFFS